MKNIIKISSALMLVVCICFFKKCFWKSDSIKEPENINFQKHDLRIKEIKIPSATQPIWFVKTKNPTVSFSIKFKNEGYRNFKTHPGITCLLAPTLMDGAGQYSATKIREILAYNNINLSISFNVDNANVRCYTVSQNVKTALSLLKDILINAHFSPDKIQVNKQNIIQKLNQEKFSPDCIAANEFVKHVYSKDHAYHITNEDILANVSKYTKGDLLKIYNSVFNPKNAEVIIAGDVREEEITTEFEKLFSELKKCKHSNFGNVEQKTEPIDIGKVIKVQTSDPQVSVVFYHPGIKTNEKDIFAIILANMIIGGDGFSSRLFKTVRNQNGLAYFISCSLIENDMMSIIKGRASTQPKNVDKLIDLAKQTFRKIKEDGITQEELDYYKVSIAASDNLVSASDVVSFLSNCRGRNIAIDKANEFTSNFYNLKLDDVNNAIKKLFDENKITFIVVGKKND